MAGPYLGPILIRVVDRLAFRYRPHTRIVARKAPDPPHIDERIAMLRAGPPLVERRRMSRGAVALVHGEAVARVIVLHRHHEAVPADLGQHAGRGDTGRRGVATNHR